MKEIKLLESQIEKLTAKDFDLDAWKQYTIVLLSRIFGEHDPKIKQVEKIEYDFSSWALRDTSGKSSYMDTCKKLGREILQASVDELKVFGLPDISSDDEKYVPIKAIIEALEEELKVSQIRKIRDIVNSDKDSEEKIKALKDLIHPMDKEITENIVLMLLSHESLKHKL